MKKAPLLDWFFRPDSRVTSWAMDGEEIPLRCSICGAVFYTGNRNYIGCSPVKYGEDVRKCVYCETMRHSKKMLAPDYRSYKKRIADRHKGFPGNGKYDI